jgi:hypothetical protein
VHGRAGAEWASAHGDRGLLAREIGDRVPEIVRGLVRGGLPLVGGLSTR